MSGTVLDVRRRDWLPSNGAPSSKRPVQPVNNWMGASILSFDMKILSRTHWPVWEQFWRVAGLPPRPALRNMFLRKTAYVP